MRSVRLTTRSTPIHVSCRFSHTASASSCVSEEPGSHLPVAAKAEAKELQEHENLLGYSLRRVAANEMLYGGVRIRHLVQPAFPLKRIKSELLPAPSLQRERDDLGLEMQMPRHKDPTQLPNYAIQRQVGHTHDTPSMEEKTFDLGQFYNDVHPPALHHNSSLPYDVNHDSNNVLALRIFPVNIGIRDRTEAIRLRTTDCLHRVQQWQLTSRLGLPTMYPLPQNVQYRIKKKLVEKEVARRPRSLHSGAIDSSSKHTADTLPVPSGEESFVPHMSSSLRFHPSPSSLSIFTRPEDVSTSLPSFIRGPTQLSFLKPTPWMPFQMLKPMGYNWSPARRSSGTRGPSSQLNQERLDQKGFGWKRKSRYLWQQDINTAGFRPHRFY